MVESCADLVLNPTTENKVGKGRATQRHIRGVMLREKPRRRRSLQGCTVRKIKVEVQKTGQQWPETGMGRGWGWTIRKPEEALQDLKDRT